MEKTISLKALKLTNFKGARDLTVSFSLVTEISGRNGSGKTTVFDAFCYALFGKDSLGRSSFGIKTVGEDGEPLWKLPHEVEATLEVNGQTITILRGWKEKWVKKHGETEAVFSGHDEVRMFNGVPQNAREMQDKIAEVFCDETTFRLVSNPSYFASLAPDAQRAILMEMVGGITYDEVAKGNKEFTALLAELNGLTLSDFKKSIAVKKKSLEKEIDDIPPRIEENNNSINNTVSFSQDEMEQATDALEEVEKQINDEVARVNAKNGKRLELAHKLSEARENLQHARYDARESAMADFYQKRDLYAKNKHEYEELLSNIDCLRHKKIFLEREREELDKKRQSLLEEWKTISMQQLSINEEIFVCPTCGRRYELNEIDNKKKEMQEHFNKEKADKLSSNIERGLEVKNLLEANEKNLKEINEEFYKLTAKRDSFANIEEPIEPTSVGDIDNLPSVKAIKVIVDDLQKQMDAATSNNEESSIKADLDQRKKKLQSRISKLNENRMVVKRNASIKERIAELEKKMTNLSQTLADLEKKEMCAEQFSYAQSEMLEQKVNGMFAHVKFRLFEKQINGGLKETCVLTANGVPYRDLNSAMRIHAGCDILNTIAKVKGISAPIWIDNAETLNEIPSIESQMITLRVSENNSLQIK